MRSFSAVLSGSAEKLSDFGISVFGTVMSMFVTGMNSVSILTSKVFCLMRRTAFVVLLLLFSLGADLVVLCVLWLLYSASLFIAIVTDIFSGLPFSPSNLYADITASAVSVCPLLYVSLSFTILHDPQPNILLPENR